MGRTRCDTDVRVGQAENMETDQIGCSLRAGEAGGVNSPQSSFCFTVVAKMASGISRASVGLMGMESWNPIRSSALYSCISAVSPRWMARVSSRYKPVKIRAKALHSIVSEEWRIDSLVWTMCQSCGGPIRMHRPGGYGRARWTPQGPKKLYSIFPFLAIHRACSFCWLYTARARPT